MSATAQPSVQKAFGKLLSTPPLDDSYIQRFSEAAVEGDVIVQGDVYFTKLADNHSFGKKLQQPVPKLVPGTSKGSQHCLADMSCVTLYEGAGTVLDGPQMKVHKEVTVTHPEHRWVVLTPGCYRVNYQRKFAEELAAQQD